MTRVALLLALIVPLSGATLAKRIDELIAASPAARQAFWGIQVVDLASGKITYQLNPRSFFVPASNTKLFTTSLALSTLGPGFTFRTRVLAGSAPDGSGVVRGPLYLVGGGDPNLSPRPIPYRMGAYNGNPLVAVDDLAAQIAARGVKRIEGGIVGDDRWYTWQPYAGGWSVDDPIYEYGAAVSALTINDNVQSVNIQPAAREGEMAALQLNPPLEYYQIDNRVVTVAAGGTRRIRYERLAGSRELKIWGTIPLKNTGETLQLGIDDPAEFAARALWQALEEHGVTVDGRATALHQFPNEVADLAQGPGAVASEGLASTDGVEAEGSIELASHVSQPLLEDLRVTDKVSQNLHAEMTLRAVGKSRRNIGSREAGLEEMKAFLLKAGIAEDAWHLNDGSGLARSNLVTPETVVKLLRYMYNSAARQDWISLLPVGGQDGTLNSRFAGSPVAGRVHAKTGSVAHVSALSGYIERPRGGWLAFSILVNNFGGPAGEIRGVMDRICALIAEPRP